MPRFVFFGGKGGVGKTTVSSAFAVKLADEGLKTLIVSTDPAHSTADVFGQSFGNDPQPVDGIDNLSALEIDPEEELHEHMLEVKRAMDEQVSTTIVNELDRHIEMAHQTPGAYEAALFDRIIEIMRESDAYDRIVFDTSPTGSTLRLLSLPDHLEGWIERLEEKRARSLKLFEYSALGEDRRDAERRTREDPIVNRLRVRKEQFEFAGEVLRNDSAFYLVMNPDSLSIEETRRAIATLEEHDLSVDGLVINRVSPPPDEADQGDGGRFLREKYRTEQARIATIHEEFSVPVVGSISTRTEEITGNSLREILPDIAIGVSTP